jgi:hypothetical protein
MLESRAKVVLGAFTVVMVTFGTLIPNTKRETCDDPGDSKSTWCVGEMAKRLDSGLSEDSISTREVK